ncbi:MAG: thrombospondin type 3 repeat-containing protein, partial [Candidatus Arcticimaribacter sp.]
MLRNFLFAVLFIFISPNIWANETITTSILETGWANSSLNSCTISIVSAQGEANQTVEKMNIVQPYFVAIQTDCEQTLQARLSGGSFPPGVRWVFEQNNLAFSGYIETGAEEKVYDWEITIDNSVAASENTSATNATTNLVFGGAITVIENTTTGTGDQDGDGVEDSIDFCPDTPAGTTVDTTGCPVNQTVSDQDGDGVEDSIDFCPDTPAGTTVDTTGCPINNVSCDFTVLTNPFDQSLEFCLGEAITPFEFIIESN